MRDHMRFPGLLLVALLAVCARFADAQATDTTRREPGGTVSGTVHDSLAQRPLVGAVVQLVAVASVSPFNRTAITDSLGRFTLGDVPDGRYMLGFFHAMLDSLGLEPPAREVFMDGRPSLRVDLAIPSPSRMRSAICAARSQLDSGGVVVGVVRDARGLAPAEGANVIAEWLELVFASDGVERRTPRVVATTGASGWFALCGVPRPGAVSVVAARGADNTDRLEVQIPTHGFLRRDLFVGPAPSIVSVDTLNPQIILREGPNDVRLIGTVVSAVGRQPVRGAVITLSGRLPTRSNERGEWTIIEPSAGTRMLEVKALGFYPERRPVDVIPGRAPIRVVLSTLRSVLDTVRVSVARFTDRHRSGFEERRRRGLGHFLTAQDIARRQPNVVTDLFRAVPRMRVERSETGDVLELRGTFEEWCAPSIYLNGTYMGELAAAEIDNWVRPRELAAVEVYAGVYLPPEFNRGLASPACGVVALWIR